MNTSILLTGIAGTGKRTIGQEITELNPVAISEQFIYAPQYIEVLHQLKMKIDF